MAATTAEADPIQLGNLILAPPQAAFLAVGGHQAQLQAALAAFDAAAFSLS